jgi:hypothetical protein
MWKRLAYNMTHGMTAREDHAWKLAEDVAKHVFWAATYRNISTGHIYRPIKQCLPPQMMDCALGVRLDAWVNGEVGDYRYDSVVNTKAGPSTQIEE